MMEFLKKKRLEKEDAEEEVDVEEQATDTEIQETESAVDDCECADNTDALIESLRAENDELRKKIFEQDRISERMGREINEFFDMFPDVALDTIPDEVWDSVKGGIPLTASYARHEISIKKQLEAAEKVNGANAQRSSGAIKGGENFYYSPDEVKNMSEQEVRRNYAHIIESMSHWN